MRGLHVRLGATATCLFPTENLPIFILHREIYYSIQNSRKKDKSPYSFSRNWRFTTMVRFNRKEKAAIFLMRALMTREIMRSRDAQCNTGKCPKSLLPSGLPLVVKVCARNARHFKGQVISATFLLNLRRNIVALLVATPASNLSRNKFQCFKRE